MYQNPCAFWKYLTEKLGCGIPQAPIDPCLVSGKICYVDGLIFWARNDKDIVELAIQLCAKGVDLYQEGDAARFLGDHIERNPGTGFFSMMGKGLFKQVGNSWS